MTDKPKKNSLTDAQKFALRDWLLGQEMNGTTYASMTELTKAAQASHDFQITACNMSNLQSSANVFLIQHKQKKVAASAELSEVVTALSSEVRLIDIALVDLQSAFNNIANMLISKDLIPRDFNMFGENHAN